MKIQININTSTFKLNQKYDKESITNAINYLINKEDIK